MIFGQITFIINDLPNYTPLKDSIFITGNFNNWNPGDKNYCFNKADNGSWIFQFENKLGNFEYKFTRGNWSSVEGGEMGAKIENRQYEGEEGGSDTVSIQIVSWEDLKEAIDFKTKIPIRLTKIPENTPVDASIFVTGNFNGWNPKDNDYRMKKEKNGNWVVEVPIRSNTLEFKFTRGNWTTVEGKRSGRARLNRVHIFENPQNINPIEAKIETWEDLAGRLINFYTFLLLMAVGQSILLIIAINTIQDNNVKSNLVLSILILIMSLALLGRVSVYDRGIFNSWPKLLLLPDFIYFLYGPLFLIYIRQLLTISRGNKTNNWVHFIPFALHLLFYVPLILMNKELFIEKVVNLSIRPYFILTGGLALLFNVFYWYKCRNIIRAFTNNSEGTHSFEQNVEYLNTVMRLKALCLGVWLLTFLVGGLGWLSQQDVSFITDVLTDTIWLLFALLVYFLGYFAMKQPEIFRVQEERIIEKEQAKEQIKKVSKVTPSLQSKKNLSQETSFPSPKANQELMDMKKKLANMMQVEKPYLNPRLTLSDLAERVPTTIHILSKVINEGFEKNFFDFVNSYRVEEFKRRVIMKEYRNQTFLAVALSVGFNSKTAFNRAFKKLTGTTPRAYLKSVEG